MRRLSHTYSHHLIAANVVHLCPFQCNTLQAEAAKTRSDIEARNTALNTDLAKATKLGEDLSRKVASLTSLNDAKTQSIQLLEKDQEHNKGVILAQEMRLRELVSVKAMILKWSWRWQFYVVLALFCWQLNAQCALIRVNICSKFCWSLFKCLIVHFDIFFDLSTGSAARQA